MNPFHLDTLEARGLFSAITPTAGEQFLVELINRARANPLAEAARVGVNLNEGLPAGTISAAAKQPLAINLHLINAARHHAQWILDNNDLSHTEFRGAGSNFRGKGSAERIAAAGYRNLDTDGEVMALTGGAGDDLSTALEQQRLWIVDQPIRGRLHRVNQMRPELKEIGPAEVRGTLTKNVLSVSKGAAAIAVEDMATSDNSRSFLTGVAYTDAIDHNHFYTPGEGLGGIVITAIRLSDHKTFKTKTWASGGYTLALDPGTYKVTGNGAGLGKTVTYAKVQIRHINVKRDFLP